MAILKLKPGIRVSLTSICSKIDVGIGISSKCFNTLSIVDIAMVCKTSNKIETIWYGNPASEENFAYDDTINCNGSSWDDDDLRVVVDFTKVPENLEKISIVTSFFQGGTGDLGKIEHGYMKVYNHENREVLYEQDDIDWRMLDGKKGMIWCEIYKHQDAWKLKCVGISVDTENLGETCKKAASYL